MTRAIKTFLVHDPVRKIGGDYSFEGHVVAVFRKLDRTSIRYVVENFEGVLHIYSAKNLELRK